MATFATLKRMSAAQLSELILSGASPTKLAVVDVRDDDHIGGHIKGSIHFASGSLDATMPSLIRKLQDTETVVFHCALSQQRGPGAALRYLRARDEKVAQRGKDIEGEPNKIQQVYVLDRGFVGWQELYGEDVRLTEQYRKELWRDY